MSIISYAQNKEDIMLWRALKDISNGFYVDIGASDPVEDSVTKLFYDNGWHGINVEPSIITFSRLQKERTRDINLSVAVGKIDGKTTFYDSKIRGWSTSNKNVGEIYFNQGNAIEKEVELMRLDTILNKYHNDNPIHFLKIDVEGAEKEVIEGLTLSRYRPWIILIEAIDPITQKPAYMSWEHKILNEEYFHVYFDGLNRFYISKEQENRSISFNYPPNVLDNFIHYSIIQLRENEISASKNAVKAEERAVEAEERAAKAEERAAKAEERAAKAEERAEKAEERAEKILKTIEL